MQTTNRGLLKNYTKRERKDFPFVALLLLLPVLQFLVFYVYINFSSFALAFSDESGNFDPNLKFLNQIFAEFGRTDGNSLWIYLSRSTIQWTISTFINFPITILFTYVLFKHVKGEMAFRIIFYLPNIIGTVVYAALFSQVVSVDGPIFALLKSLNVELPKSISNWGLLLATDGTSFGTIIAFGIWLALGGNTVVLTGAMTRIPEEIFESAQIEGAGVWREFFQLVVPLIWSTISTLLIFQLAAITTYDFGTYLLLGSDFGMQSDRPVQTMGYYIFMLTFYAAGGDTQTPPNRPSALGIIITVVTVPFVMICRAIIEKFSDPVEF